MEDPRNAHEIIFHAVRSWVINIDGDVCADVIVFANHVVYVQGHIKIRDRLI